MKQSNRSQSNNKGLKLSLENKGKQLRNAFHLDHRAGLSPERTIDFTEIYEKKKLEEMAFNKARLN